MDATMLRIMLAVIGLIVLAVIYWSGSRPAAQGRRLPPAKGSGERAEPVVGDARSASRDGLDPDIAAELDRLGREIQQQSGDEPDDALAPGKRTSERMEPTLDLPFPEAEPIAEAAAQTPAAIEVPWVESNVGARSSDKTDRIVTVFVAATDGQFFAGADIIVAAEKTGLAYGALGAFHRLPASPSEHGAIFSVANMLRPGRFDMSQIQALRTPGLTLFLVLPNAASALDAWDAMLPTAQRLAELLGGTVLDEERVPLSRQRIQHIRDELRAYDRAQEKNTIRKTW